MNEFEISPVAGSEALQASPQQRRIWFNDQLDESGLQFIYSSGLRLGGALDVAALHRAVNLLVERHEALRTRILAHDGAPMQSVEPPYELDLAPVPVAEDDLEGEIHGFVNRPFRLDEGRHLRAVLFEMSEDDHALILAIHHVATDGWSNEVLVAELAQAYEAYVAGGEPDLEPVSLSYRDYAAWQSGWMESGGRSQLAYWRKQLSGAPTILDLPVDRPWPATQSFSGQWLTLRTTRDLADRVSGLAQEAGASQFMVILAAFNLTLSRWTGQSDLIVGTGVENRSVPGTERIVGPFTNMLPLRTRIDETRTFRDLLRQTRETTLDAYDHLMVPFDRMVEEIAPERTPTRSPVLQATLTASPKPEFAIKGLEVHYIQSRPDSVRFDLTFYYSETSEGCLEIEANYASDVFERASIEALQERFVHLLDQLVTRPDAPMLSTDTVSPDELERLREWGDARRDAPSELVHESIRDWSRKDPDRPAFVVGEESCTFAELDAEADRIAGYLAAHGVGPETPVGLLMGRSPRLLPAIVGVLRAGGYYVPLDRSYPIERLQFMVDDCGAQLVLTDADPREAGIVPGDGVRVVTVAEAASAEPLGTAGTVHPDNLAYAIYTSGSTGTPKPVTVTHRGLSNLLQALEDMGIAGPGSGRVGWNASSSFDASVQQWVRVCRGDTVIMLTETERRDPVVLGELVESAQLTHLDITPVHLDVVLDQLPTRTAEEGPLHLLVGGEPISADLWRRIGAAAEAGTVRALNVYGPTETTVDATAAWVEGDTVSIGRPVPGVTVAVVDRLFRLAAPGAAGELVIGGAGVARGYGDAPGATARKFVANPLDAQGSRLYRSGDRVRWRTDGSLEYLGRNDRQVKVRGFRIELNEIESVLSGLPGVGLAIAAVAELPGGPGLVAYCSRAGGSTLDRDAIRAEAARRLPAFMLPEVIVVLDELPIGPGGKVDVERLPSPVAVRVEGEADDALEGAIELLIADVWMRVLGVDHVGPSDSFFSLGGHSMHATRMIAALRKQLKLPLPVTVVFQYPRLRAFAHHVQGIIRENMSAASAG